MAVIKSDIKSALESLYLQASTGDGLTSEEFADGMSDIIRNAILSADVNTNLTPSSANVSVPSVPGTYPVVGGSSTGGLT